MFDINNNTETENELRVLNRSDIPSVQDYKGELPFLEGFREFLRDLLSNFFRGFAVDLFHDKAVDQYTGRERTDVPIERPTERIEEADVPAEKIIETDTPADMIVEADTQTEKIKELESISERSAEALAEVFDNKTLEEWGTMSMEMREAKLSEFHQKLGDILGVDAKGIVLEDCYAKLGYGTNGYCTGDGYVYLDYRNIENPENLGQAVDTLIHEVRHQLQFEAIEDPSRFPWIPQETVNAWYNNFLNYDDGTFGFEGYYYQIVEVDARLFTNDVIDDYFKIMGWA
ncbi:MAG: hypothetical protein FWD13_02840 [Treponema sp.]|nr:hypothetical protein [Treponema sp.]